MGGLFSIFHKKSASKAPKTCDFAYFTSQWGARAPPAPPWLRYWLYLQASPQVSMGGMMRTKIKRTYDFDQKFCPKSSKDLI